MAATIWRISAQLYSSAVKRMLAKAYGPVKPCAQQKICFLPMHASAVNLFQFLSVSTNAFDGNIVAYEK